MVLNTINVEGVSSHLFPRGYKDITNIWNEGSLFKRLHGTDGFSKLEDLYVGDYFTTTNNNNTVTWRIAGFDVHLGIGEQGDGLTTHHAVIVPDRVLTTAKMNDTNTTTESDEPR